MLKNRFCYALVLGFLCWIPSVAQTATQPTVAKVFAVLQKSLETKTSAVGDDVVLILLNDVTADNQVVIAKGSKVLGHIGGVATKGKDEPKSVLAIRLDKMPVLQNRQQLELGPHASLSTHRPSISQATMLSAPRCSTLLTRAG